MPTYVYRRTFEVRSSNLLLNPYISYFFHRLFLFQLERNNFKQNSRLQWDLPIFRFFHFGSYFAQRIAIGNANISQNLEYLPFQLPQQMLKRIICLCLRQVNAKSRLGLHFFRQIECYVNLYLHA
jgi:hypothetical protein